MTTATYSPHHHLHADRQHSQQHADQQQQQQQQHVQQQQQQQHQQQLLQAQQVERQLQQQQLINVKQESHGLPPSLTLPPSPHHDGHSATDSSLSQQQVSVSAPATLQHSIDLTPSSSSASSHSHHSTHSPTYPALSSAAVWDQSAASSVASLSTSSSSSPLHYPSQQQSPAAPVHYNRPLPPPFYPPVAYPPPIPAPYPNQPLQPPLASSSPSQHTTPPMSYHHLAQQQQQQHQHQQQQQQQQAGQGQQASNPRHSYPPPPSAHHQANAAYSGFYPPPFQPASLPLVNSGYGGHNQAAAAHAQMVKQQQQQQQQQQQPHGANQQPPPFSPSSLHQLLSTSAGQQHSQQANHLSTHINVNLAPSAFPAQSAAQQQTPTLSSDLLYVNQRYHDIVYKLALHMKKLDEHHHHQHPVLIEDILRAIREEVNIYHAQQLNRLSAIKPEHLLSSPLSSSLSTLSSLSGAYMSNAAQMQQTDRLFCKPSRLISQFNKKPFKLLMVQIQRQYTSSKKELDLMKEKDKEKLIAIRVRLMGAPLRGHVYFVAKDLCQLIHSRKGNVAKSVSQFNENEKARMPVLCPRSNGTLSTHSLTVLTIDGIKRLLTASRSPLAPHLLKWLLGQVEVIVEQGERGDEKVGETTTVTFPKVERKGEVEVKEGDNEQEVEVMLDSDEEAGHDEGEPDE